MTKEGLYESVIYYFNEFKMFIYGVFVYLNVDIKTTKVLMWLMIIDTLFGLVKSVSIGRKLSLKKLMYGIISKFLLLLVPLVLALVGKGVYFDFTWAVTTVISLMIVSEGLSVFTNFLTIKTKKEVEQEDFITKLIIKVRGLFITILSQLFDKLKIPNIDLDQQYKKDEEE